MGCRITELWSNLRECPFYSQIWKKGGHLLRTNSPPPETWTGIWAETGVGPVSSTSPDVASAIPPVQVALSPWLRTGSFGRPGCYQVPCAPEHFAVSSPGSGPPWSSAGLRLQIGCTRHTAAWTCCLAPLGSYLSPHPVDPVCHDIQVHDP